MMQIIKPGTNLDFIGKAKVFISISILLVVLSIITLFTKGFNWGIDFAGGTVIQVKFEQAISLEEVRGTLSKKISSEFALQNFGEPNEVLIRITNHEGVGLQELADDIKSQLSGSYENIIIQRVEQVGPQVGGELRKKAVYALVFAVLGILIYIAIRFKMVYAVGAIISLLHDTIIILGVYCLSGKEFNLTVMAAVLTAAGYSLNDTIVIYDRIREKVRNGFIEKLGWKALINLSINETLSRTILTSLLTLFAVTSLFIFGGEVINGFALVMIVGIIVGTYSSIGIATLFLYRQQTKVK